MLGPSRLGCRREVGSTWSHWFLSFLEPVGLGTMSFTQRGRNTEGHPYFKPLLLPACQIPLNNTDPTARLPVSREKKHIPPQLGGQLGRD